MHLGSGDGQESFPGYPRFQDLSPVLLQSIFQQRTQRAARSAIFHKDLDPIPREQMKMNRDPGLFDWQAILKKNIYCIDN